jgi:hypothetical protein
MSASGRRQNASSDLQAALLQGHRGQVGERFVHCGLLADVPTTAFA